MKKIYNIYDAAESLRPGKGYNYRGGEWTWETGVTAPTQSELDAEVSRLQAIEDGLEWSRNRADEYPSVVDQLDLIYHSGIDAWKAKIKETKDKYPKP
tara:strand:- start:180 stop:473 length:294 start_codon:yes stop_codon:yes gene_type:complete